MQCTDVCPFSPRTLKVKPVIPPPRVLLYYIYYYYSIMSDMGSIASTNTTALLQLCQEIFFSAADRLMDGERGVPSFACVCEECVH